VLNVTSTDLLHTKGYFYNMNQNRRIKCSYQKTSIAYTLIEFYIVLDIICNRIISVSNDKKHILFVVKLLSGLLLLRIQYYGSSIYKVFIQLVPPSKPTDKSTPIARLIAMIYSRDKVSISCANQD